MKARKPKIYKANGFWYLDRSDLPSPILHYTFAAALRSLQISLASRWWE